MCEVAEEDVLQMFFKDRELNGDFISKTSDMFWLMGALKFFDFDADAGKFADNSEQAHQVAYLILIHKNVSYSSFFLFFFFFLGYAIAN